MSRKIHVRKAARLLTSHGKVSLFHAIQFGFQMSIGLLVRRDILQQIRRGFVWLRATCIGSGWNMIQEVVYRQLLPSKVSID